MTRRAANNKELEAYLEKTAKEGTTRELNGNIVITQGEMLEKVFLPLRAQLQELLRRARADAAQYACLSRQLRGCARQTLARLADSSRQEARTLAALYYLETGQRAVCDAVSPETYACPAAALRRQHARQLARAEADHALAGATPAYAETLHCLADRATARAKALVAALRDCL